MRAPSCLSGKLKWLQNRFGTEFQDYVLTAHKYRLANEAAVLIDDSDGFVDDFKQAGGATVLFPQMWNSYYDIENKVDYTIEQVKDWHERLK